MGFRCLEGSASDGRLIETSPRLNLASEWGALSPALRMLLARRPLASKRRTEAVYRAEAAQ